MDSSSLDSSSEVKATVVVKACQLRTNHRVKEVIAMPEKSSPACFS
jgi:hypothetical protein